MKFNKRFFEIISNYSNANVKLPERATEYSAGYDLVAAENVIFKPFEMRLVPTGIKVCLAHDEFLMICARSSLFINKKLILANSIGIIDHDYYNNSANEGHILINLYNLSKQIIKINKDERIAQGIFQKYFLAEHNILQVNKKAIKRRGGFGSTNKS